MRQRRAPARRVAVVAFPGVQVLDVTGPLEVFACTDRWLGEHGTHEARGYTIELLATTATTIATSSGLRLAVDRRLGDRRGRAAAIDTLLVAGGIGTAAALQDRALLRWLRAQAPYVRRLGSVCSGAFILAEAGLLDNRRVTTHWRWCGALAQRYPEVRVEADPIFVRDGNIYTSAGVTAGMDLALALVEEDHGHAVAVNVARDLVLFLRRPGGQSQFSTQLAVQAADREPVREVQAWIADHLGDDLSVPALAARATMSPRNFARVFTREVGTTPARFVEQARLEAARRRLEESAHGVDAIAMQCGFGSSESMRRTFLRRLQVPPSAYRHRFNSARLH